MFLKLHSFILPLCNNPPAHPHHSPNLSDLTDVCQHFVVLLCNMEVTATAQPKKFTLLLLLLSRKCSLRKYWGQDQEVWLVDMIKWHFKEWCMKYCSYWQFSGDRKELTVIRWNRYLWEWWRKVLMYLFLSFVFNPAKTKHRFQGCLDVLQSYISKTQLSSW